MEAASPTALPATRDRSWGWLGCVAINVVIRVVWNSLVCSLVAAVVIAVLAAFAFGAAADKKSTTGCAVTIMTVWSNFAICATILIAVVQGMEGRIRAGQFVTTSLVQKRWPLRLIRVLQLVWLPWAACAAIHAATTYALAILAPEVIVRGRAHLYVLIVGGMMIQTVLELAALEILRVETSRKHANRSLARRVLRVGRRQWPRWLMVFAMSAFIHLATVLRSVRGPYKAPLCTATSLFIEMSLQELGKTIMLRRETLEPAVLILVIAVPTLVVDTQLRIVLLDIQSQMRSNGEVSSNTMQWIALLVLAPVELIIRSFNVFVLVRQLRRIDRKTGPSPGNSTIHVAPSSPVIKRRRSSVNAISKYDKMLLLHATEVTAEMCAEYIAIGCSTSMFYLLSNHPHFPFACPNASASSLTVVSVIVQSSSEMVVDFICSLTELRWGVPLTISHDVKGMVLTMFTLVSIGIVCFSALASVK